MPYRLAAPAVAELPRVLDALRAWQVEGAPFQLHPGDLGWFWRSSPEATAAALRIWSSDGDLVAIGLLDGPDVLRWTSDPDARRDAALARAVVRDLADPAASLFDAGEASVEAPTDAALGDLLDRAGWELGEAWTPLHRDLADPVEDPGVRIEVIDADRVSIRTAVHRAAFPRSTFDDDRWHTMAAGPDYADAPCLVAFDDGTPVAGITVWSAGEGRPGVIEPMGVDPAGRGRGFGTAITRAGAAALRELGASSATVATPSSHVGGIATYVAAGFAPQPERRDRHRSG